jgi:hypothetical protein
MDNSSLYHGEYKLHIDDDDDDDYGEDDDLFVLHQHA